MSVLDNALQALFDMAHKEILWENASPNSTFNAQTISALCGQYDMIAIEFKGTATGNIMLMAMASYGNGIAIPLMFTSSVASTSSAIQSNYRQATLSANGIAFAATYTKYAANTTSAQNNTILIPITVYGLKLSGGGKVS